MSMGVMPWASMARMCSGLERMASRPPAILGCMVLTRPSSISGKPVTSLTSLTGMPALRIRRAVPPVEMSSAPVAARADAKSTIPVLSVTLRSTREIRAITRTITRGSGGPRPRNGHFQRGHAVGVGGATQARVVGADQGGYTVEHALADFGAVDKVFGDVLDADSQVVVAGGEDQIGGLNG